MGFHTVSAACCLMRFPLSVIHRENLGARCVGRLLILLRHSRRPKAVGPKGISGHSRTRNEHARAVGYADRVCLLAELWWRSVELLHT